MIYFQPGLYVRIEQLETELAPAPKPLQHGFNTETAYLVLGAFSLSESGEAYLVLSNDANEMWFISNRHLRTYDLRPDSTSFRFPLHLRDGKKIARANGAPTEKTHTR